VDDKIKLHIGCGSRNWPGWINIDRQNLPHIKHHSVTKLPFKDATVSLIYSSHLIAYFDQKEIIPILKEWNRVLKVGGTLRISTPDWQVMRKFDKPLLGPIFGKMSEPPIYHKTVYDEVGLHLLLDHIGFTHIRRYDHRLTEHAQFDDHSAAYHKGQLISLNIECNA